MGHDQLRNGSSSENDRGSSRRADETPTTMMPGGGLVGFIHLAKTVTIIGSNVPP